MCAKAKTLKQDSLAKVAEFQEIGARILEVEWENIYEFFVQATEAPKVLQDNAKIWCPWLAF